MLRGERVIKQNPKGVIDATTPTLLSLFNPRDEANSIIKKSTGANYNLYKIIMTPN